ncbi:hypothetical protein BC834DRAFT_973694 [Gloeopeniophorella convolvens]|nr:hypothetical protein BC834DRAFT_973694 [Gloeopeniophorella convolvens]
MFSIAKIATFAILALGTFTSAVPVVEERAAESGLKARQTDPTASVVSILTELAATLGPIAGQFSSLDPSTASSSDITPIVSSIVSEISSSAGQISALPAGTSTTSDTLQPLASVFSAALTPAAPFAASAAFIPVFAPLGVELGLLLNTVVALVDELLVVVKATLTTLLSGLIVTLSSLNFVVILSFLGL